MAQVLGALPVAKDERLLVGVENSDDAAVYKINENQALIQTLDFFTPIVDDPYTFGMIAAANSLSDIYAMGADPLLAMNIVCFPNCLSPAVLEQILKGGADKCQESGTLIVGGHTVQDDEPKYGLSVSAIIDPDKVLKNCSAKPGDLLILTKPLGVGIINTALKGGLITEKDEEYKIAVRSMTTLNRFGKDAMEDLDVNACTDITGFGLVGHCLEMAEGSEVSIEIDSKSIPMIKRALEFAGMGLVPAGSYDNRKFVGDKVSINIEDQAMIDILFDPQTSGGLLISIPEGESQELMSRLRDNPVDFSVIGRVLDKRDKYIFIE